MKQGQPEALRLADALKSEYFGLTAMQASVYIQEQHARITELEAEIEAVKAQNSRDAERYRWLRVQPNNTSTPRIDVVHWVENGDVNNGEGLRLALLDEAIDAYMAVNYSK